MMREKDRRRKEGRRSAKRGEDPGALQGSRIRRKRNRGTVLYVFDPTVIIAFILSFLYILSGVFGPQADEEAVSDGEEASAEWSLPETDSTSSLDGDEEETSAEPDGDEEEVSAEFDGDEEASSELDGDEEETSAGWSLPEIDIISLFGGDDGESAGWPLQDSDIASLFDGIGDLVAGIGDLFDGGGEETSTALWSGWSLGTSSVYTGNYDGLEDPDEEYYVIDEETGIEYVSNTILVYVKDGLTNAQKREIAQSVDGVVIGELEGTIGLLQIEVEECSLADLEAMAETLEERDEVWFASYDFLTNLDYTSSSSGSSSDSSADGDWWEDAISLDRAWEEFGDCFGEVSIGVLDTAVDTSVSEVSGKVVFPTLTIETRNQSNIGNANHGTAVTSLIVADRDGDGVDGIADQATICFSSDSSTWSYVSEGLIKLVDSGCRVINNSYGIEYDEYDYDYDVTLGAIKWAEKVGDLSRALVLSGWDGIFIVAAGNHAIDAYESGLWATYKSAHDDLDDHILIVTGTELNDAGTGYQLAAGFAYGDVVDICAPGVDIEVPWNGSYSARDGTSYAAPMVTAVAGLIWSADPDMTASEVRACLLNGSRYELTSSVSGDTYPMLDAYLAVEQALVCAYEGLVVYEDGTPAEGITVLALDEDGNVLNDAVTDENGSYVINCNRLTVDHFSVVRGDGEEEVAVLAIPEEYRAYDVDAARGDDEEDYAPHEMEDVIVPLPELYVTVTDEDGNLLGDVKVTTQDAEGNTVEAAAMTDDAGHPYYLLTLHPGTYEVQVSSETWLDRTVTVELTMDMSFTVVLSGIDVMDYLETYRELVDLLEMEVSFDWLPGEYFSVYEKDGFYLGWDSIGDFSMMNGEILLLDTKANPDVSIYGFYIGDSAEEFESALTAQGWIYVDSLSYGSYRSYVLLKEDLWYYLEFVTDSGGNLSQWSLSNWSELELDLAE